MTWSKLGAGLVVASTAIAMMGCNTGSGEEMAETSSAVTGHDDLNDAEFAAPSTDAEVCFDIEMDDKTDPALVTAALADPNVLVAAMDAGTLRGKPKPCPPHRVPLENGITKGEVWQCAMAGVDAIRFKEAEWKVINTFLGSINCVADLNDGKLTNETAKKCLTAACQASKGIPLVDKLCLAWNGLMIIDKCLVLFVKYSASLLIPETLNRLLVGWDKEDCIVGPKKGEDRTTESCLLCCKSKYLNVDDVGSGKMATCQDYCREWYSPMVK